MGQVWYGTSSRPHFALKIILTFYTSGLIFQFESATLKSLLDFWYNFIISAFFLHFLSDQLKWTFIYMLDNLIKKGSFQAGNWARELRIWMSPNVYSALLSLYIYYLIKRPELYKVATTEFIYFMVERRGFDLAVHCRLWFTIKDSTSNDF